MTDILRLALPLTLWLASFSGVYGLQGALCATGAEAVARPWLVAAAVGAVAAQAGLALLLAAPRLASPRPFVRRVSLGLAVAASVAAAWTLLPVATTSVCR